MKKRFFAGLLACLMVVGLLPLSMWLKPVNAKADPKEYEFSIDTIGTFKGEKQIVSDIFTIYPFNASGDAKAAKASTKVGDNKKDCFKFGAASKYDNDGVPTSSYIKITFKNTIKI